MILYLVYYGLPKFGISFESLTAACIGLTWNAAAYSSEMFRAGLQSVPRGQIEASQALGLHRVAHLLPGASCRRECVRRSPGLMGLAIQMFQGTSLAYGIAVPELMKTSYAIGSRTFNYLEVFILAGLVYAVHIHARHLDYRLLRKADHRRYAWPLN